MKYEVVVLPKDTEGKINRQIYEFDDFESAKQNFHTQCGKYFKANGLQSASVCVLDDMCNKLLSDSWKATEVTE